MAAEQLGSGTADGVIVGVAAGAGTKVAFYGATPVAQWRKSTAVQYSSLLATMTTTTGSLLDGANLSTLNQAISALQEVMASLQAYGLWQVSG